MSKKVAFKTLASLFENFLTLTPDSNEKYLQPPFSYSSAEGIEKPTV